MMRMKSNFPFRAWFYFRQGWATYFAFIFSAINTLVVTYYLAIDNAPFLKTIFPSFTAYVAILVAIGVPILVVVGYMHYKRSPAFKTEAVISFESNPPLYRLLQNTEITLPIYLQITNILLKLSRNEKLTQLETEELARLQDQLTDHINKKPYRK
jgi:hypothetical protein